LHSCQTSNSPSALRATGSFRGPKGGRRGTPEGRRAPPCNIQVKLQTRHPPFGRLARFKASTCSRCRASIRVKLQTRHPPFGRLARFDARRAGRRATPEGPARASMLHSGQTSNSPSALRASGSFRRLTTCSRCRVCNRVKLQTRHPPFGRLARFKASPEGRGGAGRPKGGARLRVTFRSIFKLAVRPSGVWLVSTLTTFKSIFKLAIRPSGVWLVSTRRPKGGEARDARRAGARLRMKLAIRPSGGWLVSAPEGRGGARGPKGVARLRVAFWAFWSIFE